MTIKISQLFPLTAATGNVTMPVVANVGGSLTTLQTTLEFIKPYFISGVEANLTIANTIQSTATINANIGMRGYVDRGNTIQSNQITAANVGMAGYVDNQITTVNTAITTANVGMKGYVDSRITLVNAAITTANVGMKGYADAITIAWQSNAAAQQSLISNIQSTLNSSTANIQVNNITANQLFINSTNNATAINNAGTNGVGNIGASGAAFNTVFARATTAQYADLAERYQADEEYSPGTVLMFGGEHEVTIADKDTAAVAGVVSTNPAYQMNDNLTGINTVAVALVGRVPCKVKGPVTKGAMLASAGDGYAYMPVSVTIGQVVGKSLESFNGDEGVIEIVAGRL